MTVPVIAEAKDLPTLGVLGIITGICLEEGGFSKIHEVMDFLYPGIMTLGIVGMADAAVAEILKQHPELAKDPPCMTDSYEQWTVEALAKYGPTMRLARISK